MKMKWSELDDQELLTTPKLAKWLGISQSKLEKARMKKGRGPSFIKMEAAVRYRVGDVRKWMDEMARESTRTAFAYGLDEEPPQPEDIEEWLGEGQQ